jgi:two-component system CheB/CheR fusion protein
VPDEQLTPPLAGAKGDENPGREPDQQFAVVAVGASAGGLEAFTEFLRRLPTDTGLAFVFIQHLAPQHNSMLSQLLSRETAMPVNQVEDGTVLTPNQVYVIPPNAGMTISGLALALKPREIAGTAIDLFLRSLAASRKSSAIAVILSGTGSDGALGIQAIAEEGGVVFAQDPASAKFDGMPRSAIATGCVDFVLPPEGIAAEVARIAREPRVIQRDIPEASVEAPDSQKDFEAVLDLVRAGTGIDFSNYRQTTVRRRLLRRLALLRLGTLRDYVEYVKENPGELHALTQDVLIRVTHFFRDPEAFEVLGRRVFPALIRKTPADSSVRIWVAGCSTGEEAYSIAICFLEAAEQMRSRVPVQVFATDINEAAIEKARRGVYIENIAADVSPERLGRFFVREGKDYHVSRRLRDLCIFSPHDLLNDPPFSRMGLVSCRNVLIYLDSMQGQAISKFHFALNPGGFLLLGRSETASSFPDLFSPLDKEVRLYTRQESARHPAPAARKKGGAARPVREAPALRPVHAIDVRRQADRVMVQRYGPPRVIVDSNLEALADSDENAAFLGTAPGARNQKVLEVLKRSAADALTQAVRTAAKTGQSIRVDEVKLGEGASLHEVSLEVTPLGPERQHFLIVVEDFAGQPETDLEPGEARTGGGKRKFETRIGRLEKELASSRAHLESVIIEQESANEEVVASNEELQSLNEELESSKEELEATNEELTTVNQELQVRNTELENAREFAQATIDTVRGSLVVLGPDLRVLKANRSFYRTFRLSPAEVERRFIYELGDGFAGVPRLRVLLEEILPANRILEDVEVGNQDPSTGGRILLLNARRFEGEERILLAIEDVTERRRAEVELRQSQKMEAIGYLAAGVAHDFNNLLTGVIGNASLLLDSLPENHPGRSTVESVISGGERAAELTRQLLAYAGKGRFYLERVDLSDVVLQTSRLIHASVPPTVQLRLDLDKHLPLLLADPGQMQQVVMNLIINAVEAVGEGKGIVQVRTGCQTVADEPLENCVLGERVARGEYIFIEVLDNGPGMDEETKRKIFDPFFTTKFTGRGLGLAAVLGIVRQHKGVVQVHSVTGRGSSFRALFSAGQEAPRQIAQDVVSEDLTGAGTVLVIDDEELIRSFSRSALEPYGYRVLLAQNGQEGVRIFQERSRDIGLVLLDVAMPGMDGLETLTRIREIRTNVPILVCSGFGDVEVEARFAGKAIAGFFPKPYTVKQLAKKVKECIAQATDSAGG